MYEKKLRKLDKFWLVINKITVDENLQHSLFWEIKLHSKQYIIVFLFCNTAPESIQELIDMCHKDSTNSNR